MVKPVRYKSAVFLYDEDSKELICGNCFERMNDSDVMRRVGSIWFCQECAKPVNLTVRALKEVIEKP